MKMDIILSRWYWAVLFVFGIMACTHDGRNEVIYKEIPLLQGWNKLVIKIGDGDRNDFSGFFKCDNKKDFLPTLKAAFTNPETR